jgi:hypothetical protein
MAAVAEDILFGTLKGKGEAFWKRLFGWLFSKGFEGRMNKSESQG